MPVAQNHQSDWKRAVVRRFSAPAVLLLIGVLFHWKLVLTNQFTWLESPDLAYQVLPWFQFQAGEWHHGRFPSWDPNGWAGQPLFGLTQPGAAYPLNWLLFLVPLDHGWLRQDALHWYYVLIHCLAALTSYAFCRDLGRSRIASIIGGCVFSLGGYVAYTDWPQMLNGAIWAPLVFLYMFRAERGEKPLSSSLLSGFFLGVAWLAGHHQMQIFLSITAAATWGWLCVRRVFDIDGQANWKLARLAALSVAIAVLASGFQTVSTAEYGRQAVRWVGADEPQGLDDIVPYNVHSQYALKPISLLGIFVAGVDHNSYDPFVGVVAFAFAVLGAILAWRERQVRWLATIALCGIVFALGPNSLLHGVIYALVPLAEKARVPAAGSLIFAIGVAPLAAFGIDWLPIAESAPLLRRTRWVLAGFGGILAIASLMFFAAKIPLTISDNRMVITALCAILAAALLTAWHHAAVSTRGATVAALALILFELANVTDYWLPQAGNREQSPYLYRLSEHYDMALYLRAQGEPARFAYDEQAIPYNIGDWYGIEAFNASVASVPQRLWQHDVFSPRVQDVLGIKYYFGKTAQRPDQREVFEGRSGLKIFENPNAFPRTWAVHGAKEVKGWKLARTTLADPRFDARNNVFLIDQQPPHLAACPGDDDISMPRHSPTYVVILATMKCRGMVILTDTWFAGWRARVDGRPAKIEQAYGAVRGVVVEAGDHTIEMRYRPWSLFVGAAMTLLAAAIVVLARRR